MMKDRYLLELDADEAATLRTILKDHAKSELASVELLKPRVEDTPNMQMLIDYMERTAAIYISVYEMLGRKAP